MDDAFQALTDSTRTGERTRQVLRDRANQPVEGGMRFLSEVDYACLDAVTRRLFPQDAGDSFVDLAAAIDAALQDGTGDGWRYDDLPPDREAFAIGLAWISSLARDRHSAAFAVLPPAEQDNILSDVLTGRVACPQFNSRLWCEDLLAAAAEAYVAHPATLARMGYSGIAFRPHWTAVGLGTTQSWEPVAR